MTEEVLTPINLGGRPSKYSPDYCEKLVIARAGGESIPRACMIIGVSRSTYYEWIKAHPEFKEAADRADTVAAAWWLELGKQAMMKDIDIKTSLYITLMDRQFGPAKLGNEVGKTEINIGNMNVLNQLDDDTFKQRLISKLGQLRMLKEVPEDTDESTPSTGS